MGPEDLTEWDILDTWDSADNFGEHPEIPTFTDDEIEAELFRRLMEQL